jgi:hypothetical protein
MKLHAAKEELLFKSLQNKGAMDDGRNGEFCFSKSRDEILLVDCSDNEFVGLT